MIIFKLYKREGQSKYNYYSVFDDGIDEWVSDCKISIFATNSFLKSRATRLTVGLGTPNSSTTFE